MESIKEKEDKLIRSNLGLVIKVAKGFNPKDINELDEYIQVGTISLLTAIRRHRPNKGSLSTIAWYYVYYGILKVIQEQSRYHQAIPQEPLYDNSATMPMGHNLWESLPSSLTAKELQIITMRLEYQNTFKEIGKQMGGYTRGWADKIYRQAIRKVRKAWVN